MVRYSLEIFYIFCRQVSTLGRKKALWVLSDFIWFPSFWLGTQLEKKLLIFHFLHCSPGEAKQELRGQRRSQAELGNQ
jgi:hypothetical protein